MQDDVGTAVSTLDQPSYRARFESRHGFINFIFEVQNKFPFKIKCIININKAIVYSNYFSSNFKFLAVKNLVML